jgi:photosystem II stability/assembly factor-like uncharacterized protein
MVTSMNATIILVTTGNGIARAEVNDNGEWSVAAPLPNKDVRCMARDPLDARTIYAGTQGEGVLCSNDFGATWQPAGLPGSVVKSLAVSPHEPSTIFAGVKPAGMHVSHDGGKTWTELAGFQRIPNRWWWFSPAESPYQAYVQNITISPSDPKVILAGIEFGAVVRSQDGGQTWSRHRKGALRDNHWLAFHGSNGNWAYQAGGTGGGASFSQDGGKTWRKAKHGLAKNYGVACAADPQKPEVWYVSVAPGPGKAYGPQAEAYLYRSAGGAGWQPIGWGDHPLSSMPIALVTHPAISGQLYAGLTNGQIWFSNDYGDHWQQIPVKFSRIFRSMLILHTDN